MEMCVCKLENAQEMQESTIKGVFELRKTDLSDINWADIFDARKCPWWRRKKILVGSDNVLGVSFLFVRGLFLKTVPVFCQMGAF